MPHNGFYLRLQERMSMGLIAQGTELFHQQWAPVYPSDQGFHGASGSNVGTIKQSQFGLGIRANVKHKKKFWNCFSMFKDTKFPSYHQTNHKDILSKRDKKRH
jgi:hypothetical protein